MTRAEELVALAERVEALTEASREVDVDIKEAVGHSWDYAGEWRGWGVDEHGRAIERPTAFPYTASLDAAMTLVPEGLLLRVGQYSDSAPKWEAVIAAPDNEWWTRPVPCATPALALTAASLRALATMEADRG